MRRKGKLLLAVSVLSLQLMAGTAVAANAAEISSQQIYVKAETAQASSKLQTPVLEKVQNFYYGQVITWKKVAGATSYNVYCKRPGGKWSKIATTKSLSYTNKKVTVGATYIYTVRAVNGSNISKYDTKGKSLKYINAPTKTSISNVKDGIKVTWKKASGAAGYYVYRKETNGKWKKIKTIKNANIVSYTDTGVKNGNGKTYVYCVKSYSGKVTNRGTDVTICRLAAGNITGASAGTTSIKVSWKQNSSASGYQICYKIGNSKKYLTVNGNTTTAKTISGLKIGATYRIYVRSYKKVSNKTYYSTWSGGKSITLKVDEIKEYKAYVNKEKSNYFNYSENYYDINGDGIKELFLNYWQGGNRSSLKICAYTQGKIKVLWEDGGSPSVYADSKSKEIIIKASSGAAYTNLYFYKFNGKDLIKTDFYYTTTQGYYRKGKRISASEFTQVMNNITSKPHINLWH